MSTTAKKIPLQQGKSAEKLKLKLASAVSAKIAANKDGKTSTNINRGIGYLLQRKQQQSDSKVLNTKDITLPIVRKIDEDASEGSDQNSGSLKTKSLQERTASQKSLLNALMRSRLASGGQEGTRNIQTARMATSKIPTYNREGSARGIKTDGMKIAKLVPPKVAPKPRLNKEFTRSVQDNKSKIPLDIVTKLTTSSKATDIATKDTTNVDETKQNLSKLYNESNTKSSSEIATKNTLGKPSSNSIKVTSNENENEYKITSSPLSNVNIKPINNLIVNPNEGNQFNDKTSVFETAIQKKQQQILRNANPEISKTRTENSQNPKIENSGNLKLGYENYGNSKIGYGNSVNSKSGIKNSDNSRTRIENIRNSSTFSRPAAVSPKVAPKPNRVGTLAASSEKLNIPEKTVQDKFQENLLEKLEGDVGSCKIAAFKIMEEFSVLRMRIHRIQSNLELLKRGEKNIK